MARGDFPYIRIQRNNHDYTTYLRYHFFVGTHGPTQTPIEHVESSIDALFSFQHQAVPEDKKVYCVGTTWYQCVKLVQDWCLVLIPKDVKIRTLDIDKERILERYKPSHVFVTNQGRSPSNAEKGEA